MFIFRAQYFYPHEFEADYHKNMRCETPALHMLGFKQYTAQITVRLFTSRTMQAVPLSHTFHRLHSLVQSIESALYLCCSLVKSILSNTCMKLQFHIKLRCGGARERQLQGGSVCRSKAGKSAGNYLLQIKHYSASGLLQMFHSAELLNLQRANKISYLEEV